MCSSCAQNFDPLAPITTGAEIQLKKQMGKVQTEQDPPQNSVCRAWPWTACQAWQKKLSGLTVEPDAALTLHRRSTDRARHSTNAPPIGPDSSPTLHRLSTDRARRSTDRAQMYTNSSTNSLHRQPPPTASTDSLHQQPPPTDLHRHLHQQSSFGKITVLFYR